MNREQLEKFYEDETGKKAYQGGVRIDHLEAFVREMNITDISQISIFDDRNKMKRDYRKGQSWYAGKQHDDTMLLGYTNGPGGFCQSAIFVETRG